MLRSERWPVKRRDSPVPRVERLRSSGPVSGEDDAGTDVPRGGLIGWYLGSNVPTMKPIDSGRVVRRYTQHIDSPPESVFPLLCPVREAEWLEGWSDELEMIHSDTGHAEDGCVFETRVAGRPDTVWMITRHDPIERVVEFFRVTTGLVATRLTITVDGRSDGSSSVQITYAFTPLGSAGRAFVKDTHSEDAFRADMAWWENSMNHWLRSGETLRAAVR